MDKQTRNLLDTLTLRLKAHTIRMDALEKEIVEVRERIENLKESDKVQAKWMAKAIVAESERDETQADLESCQASLREESHHASRAMVERAEAQAAHMEANRRVMVERDDARDALKIAIRERGDALRAQIREGVGTDRTRVELDEIKNRDDRCSN